VAIPDGGEATFVVEVEDTIARVKKLVWEKAGGKLDAMCLLFGGEELTNEGTLSEYNIDHDDILIMETFAISVMHWSGDVFALADIRPNNTVDDVKKRIAKMKKIPMNQLRVTLKGQPVEDEIKLTDQRIMHKSVLTLEPPGDGDTEIPERAKVSLDLVPRFTLKNVTNEEEIWPVMPDWKRRIFFFDNGEGFDAYIEITVMHWSGDTFTFDDVRLNEKVGDIKKRVAKVKKIPQHRLKVEGKGLDDKKSLVAQKIHHKSVLLMEPLQQKKIDDLPRIEKINFGLFSTRTVGKINIRVKRWNGDTFFVDVETTEYIADVKDIIQSLKNIPSDHQRLTFQGQPVDDTLTLKEQNIVHQSTLVLEPMQISVAIPDGKQFTFVVEVDDTIKRIKRLVWEKAGGKLDAMCLLFGGEELPNDGTLSEYNIDHDDILTMETFAISVMHWSGDVFALADVHPNDTIEDVKGVVLKMKQIPKNQQHFNFDGKLLKERKTLKDHEIKHKSILMMDEARQIDTTVPRQKVILSVFPTDNFPRPKTPQKGFRDQKETGVDFFSESIARASGKPTYSNESDTMKTSTDSVNDTVNLNGSTADENSAGPKGTNAKVQKDKVTTGGKEKNKNTKGGSSTSDSPKSTKYVSSFDTSNLDEASPKSNKTKSGSSKFASPKSTKSMSSLDPSNLVNESPKKSGSSKFASPKSTIGMSPFDVSKLDDVSPRRSTKKKSGSSKSASPESTKSASSVDASNLVNASPKKSGSSKFASPKSTMGMSPVDVLKLDDISPRRSTKKKSGRSKFASPKSTKSASSLDASNLVNASPKKNGSSKFASPKSTKSVSSVDASKLDDVSPKGSKEKKSGSSKFASPESTKSASSVDPSNLDDASPKDTKKKSGRSKFASPKSTKSASSLDASNLVNTSPKKSGSSKFASPKSTKIISSIDASKLDDVSPKRSTKKKSGGSKSASPESTKSASSVDPSNLDDASPKDTKKKSGRNKFASPKSTKSASSLDASNLVNASPKTPKRRRR
jgi:hypothetical protein